MRYETNFITDLEELRMEWDLQIPAHAETRARYWKRGRSLNINPRQLAASVLTAEGYARITT